MDLAAFLTRSINNGTIDTISRGYENSQFSQDIPDCGVIVRDVLDKLNEHSPKRINIPTVNGAISANQLHDSIKKITNSFSMEFDAICNNLLALCGFELSYNLSILISFKEIIQQYIISVESSTAYDEIITYINVIRNMFKRPNFITRSFESQFINQGDDDQMVFRFDSETKPAKESFFNGILDHATKNNDRKNLSGLNINKRLYVNELKNLVNNTEFHAFEPENVNELLNNIGNKIAYKGWFMKAWSLLYDELLVDMSDKDVTTLNHPLEALFEKLNINVQKNKYISQILVYFEQVIIETKRTMMDALKDNYIETNLSKDLLKYMAEMMLNLYVQLAYALYNHQRYSTFNKSSRVHYALLFYLIMTCKPKLYEFDITQQSVLRYVLLPKKSLDESLDLIKNMQSGVISQNIVSDDSSDESDEDEKPVKRKPKQQKVTRQRAKKTTINKGK